MKFYEQIHSHVGGLITLKFGIYWYYGRPLNGWEMSPGKICFILNVIKSDVAIIKNISGKSFFGKSFYPTTPALLFIDGISRWISISEDSIEFVK